jgi:cell wall-associated NlpC family hydrolase
LRVKALSLLAISSTALAVPAAPALAGASSGAGTGGTVAEAATPAPSTTTTTSGGASSTAPAAVAVPAHAAPITARKPKLTYKGPIYEKTPTGEIVPYTAPTPAAALQGSTGGSPVGVTADAKPELLVPGSLARYVDGLAAAPMSAPAVVQEVIWAANQIVGLPYIYGGGHGSFVSPGYDCSGTVSFALHGGDLLATPEDSSEFEGFGASGQGRWITIFANPGHAYMDVAGLRLDTSPAYDPSGLQGPRWRPLRPNNHGYVVRHPVAL